MNEARIDIRLKQRPYYAFDSQRTTVIAESRCGVCDTSCCVTQVISDKDLRTDGRYAAHVRSEVIESLLQALAEHEQENHAIPSDE